MTDPSPPTAPIPPDARPRLARGVRLTNSEAHGGMVLLAPERVFKADAIAAAVLAHCDGTSSLSQIVDKLSTQYSAPRDRVLADVNALLAGLAEKKLLEF